MMFWISCMFSFFFQCIWTCCFCSKDHTAWHCRLKLQSCKAAAEKRNLCLSCLRPQHVKPGDCKHFRKVCLQCSGTHHPLLCPARDKLLKSAASRVKDSENEEQTETEESLSSVASVANTCPGNTFGDTMRSVIMATFQADVLTPDGSTFPVNVDQGATYSAIRLSLAQQHKLKVQGHAILDQGRAGTMTRAKTPATRVSGSKTGKRNAIPDFGLRSRECSQRRTSTNSRTVSQDIVKNRQRPEHAPYRATGIQDRPYSRRRPLFPGDGKTYATPRRSGGLSYAIRNRDVWTWTRTSSSRCTQQGNAWKCVSACHSNRLHGLRRHWKSKQRPVFDAKAKAADGQCLNDLLYTGSPLTPDLLGILRSFRTSPHFVICDITKAFLQVGVKPEHRDLLRILVPHDVEQTDARTFRILRFTRIVMGLTSSPFDLNAVFSHHYDNCLMDTNRPLKGSNTLLEQLKANTFVDNVMVTFSDASQLPETVKALEWIYECQLSTTGMGIGSAGYTEGGLSRSLQSWPLHFRPGPRLGHRIWFDVCCEFRKAWELRNSGSNTTPRPC